MDKKYFEGDWIFDIETYPNIFTFCAVYANGKGLRTFEVSDRKNEIEDVLNFLRKVKEANHRLIGFNNQGFDYPVIHKILEKSREALKTGKKIQISANEIYEFAMKLIKNQNDDKFGNIVRDKDVIIPQVDLFKIHHFDNKARATSLKMLEFNMRSENIEDLPFPVGMELDDSRKDILIEYNKHDVLQTLKFYYYSYEHLKLREELAEKFGFNCTNFNDTKIGKQLFIDRLEEQNPGCCYSYGKFGRKIKQTIRSRIKISECLFPYVEFERDEFKAIHEWFKKQVITETKGVFTDIEEHNLDDVAKYANMKAKKTKLKGNPSEVELDKLKKQNPKGWLEVVELKAMEVLKDEDGNPIKEKYTDDKGREKERNVKVPKKSYNWCYNVAETLNVVINGFQFDYGVGGIHGAKQGTFKKSDKKRIRTLDVKSYYPNMAIANQIYPEHLGKTFCKVYADLYNERSRHSKESAANKALKLALNGVYGDSNNEFSPLCDPKYTMSITIGGQLSLCMLMEKLINHCDAEIIMCNTDGFEFILDVEKEKEADEWVKRWEKITGLEMEGDWYETMYIADVNSYVAIKEDKYD